LKAKLADSKATKAAEEEAKRKSDELKLAAIKAKFDKAKAIVTRNDEI